MAPELSRGEAVKPLVGVHSPTLRAGLQPRRIPGYSAVLVVDCVS
jgi:hypothetical protein